MITNTSLFIENLRNYNNGISTGDFLPLPTTMEDLQNFMVKIDAGKFEDEKFYQTAETLIFDWDSDLDIKVEEMDSILALSDAIEQVERLDEHDFEKLKAILETDTNSIVEAIEYLDNYDFYEGVTLEDVAYDIVDDMLYNAPSIARTYFDYKAFTRDLSYDGYKETSNGVLYGA